MKRKLLLFNASGSGRANSSYMKSFVNEDCDIALLAAGTTPSYVFVSYEQILDIVPHKGSSYFLSVLKLLLEFDVSLYEEILFFTEGTDNFCSENDRNELLQQITNLQNNGVKISYPIGGTFVKSIYSARESKCEFVNAFSTPRNDHERRKLENELNRLKMSQHH